MALPPGHYSGIPKTSIPPLLVGVCVCDDAAFFYDRIAAILRAGAMRWPTLGSQPPVHAMVELVDGFVGMGYAQNRPEEWHLLREVAEREGLVLDPVYTVKAMMGLRQMIRDRYAGGVSLRVVLQSFAYKRGVPSEADMVFDCRFLANPFDAAALRPLSGLHEPVAQFVLGQPDAIELLDRVESLVRFVVPRATRESRSSLSAMVNIKNFIALRNAGFAIDLTCTDAGVIFT